MKELIILRHAKSDRTFIDDDINRPLSRDGIQRIKKVSHQKELFFTNADIIISSPAIRALHTAIIIINELNLSLENLKIDMKLYTFSGFNIIDYVNTLDDCWNKVILVGHNPALIEAIIHFSDEYINHLRTAGFIQISFDENQWSKLSKGRVLFGYRKL